jgi:hypothetical protein
MRKYLLLLILLIPFSAYAWGYEVISGDLNTVGSVVKIADEEFYVMGQEDATHVKLLSKYNLDVGYGIDNPTNKQSERAAGYPKNPTGPPPYIGAVVFSDSVYWANQDHSLMQEYIDRQGYVYDENASVKQYVDTYVDYLNTNGVSVTGKLPMYQEFITLGCVPETNTSNVNCTSAPEWIYTTSYWTGTLLSTDGSMRTVLSSGTIGGGNITQYLVYGVRPQIILDKSYTAPEPSEDSDDASTPEVNNETNNSASKETVKGKTEEIKENPKTGVNKHLFIVLIIMLLLTIVYLRLYDIKFFKKI